MTISKFGAGAFPILDGKANQGVASTLIPITFLQDLKSRHPIPITVGSSNNGTFTLAASVTKPVRIWNGNDFIELRWNVVYTWNATSNPILDSNGAADTDTDSVLGIWYMYLDEDGTTLIPSQTAPSFVEGDYLTGYLGHPGASRAENLVYVGWMRCTTAATPAFLAMKKYGFTYHFASTNVATSTSWAALDFSASVPAIEGILVAGRLETGVVGTVLVSASSVEDQGVLTVSAVGLANNIIQAPFGPIETTGDGKIYAKDTVARGDVHISQVVDLV